MCVCMCAHVLEGYVWKEALSGGWAAEEGSHQGHLLVLIGHPATALLIWQETPEGEAAYPHDGSQSGEGGVPPLSCPWHPVKLPR